MSSLTNYNGLQVVTPDPTGPGGLAINQNFKALSTHVDTGDPTSSNDATQGFATGSRWYNYLSTSEWICRDPTAASAVWQIVSRTQSIATAASTAALAANTYANGSAGIGATLTATANGVLTVDGYAVALGDLVLVKNESAAAHNGLYVCTTAGASGAAYVLTRAGSMNSGGDFSGAMVPVGTAGTANAGTLWVANPAGAVTVGTTAIPFQQIAGVLLTAGTGITISGDTISVSTVPIANGGTGQTSQAAGFNALSPITTTGDLIVGNGTNSATRLATGTAGQVLTGGTTPTWTTPAQQARVTFDGGGSALTGTPLAWFVCQFTGTLSGYTLLADQSGSIVIDVKKADYSGFPTFSSVTGSGTKPTLSSAQKAQDSTLTGWTTAVSAGDILQFQISSVSTVQHVQLFLNIT